MREGARLLQARTPKRQCARSTHWLNSGLYRSGKRRSEGDQTLADRLRIQLYRAKVSTAKAATPAAMAGQAVSLAIMAKGS